MPDTSVAQLTLTVDDQIHFAGDPNPWSVRAVTDHFAALTRPRTDSSEYGSEDEPLYTVLDWRNGVRGPCNLSGQGWGDGTYSEAECTAMLAEFEAGDLEISHRNNVRISIVEVTG